MKVRLDKTLVDRGLAESRERARALVLGGKVLVGGLPATKAGAMVGPDSVIEVRGSDIPYVGRGGLKLEAALDNFGLDPSGLVAMDVGASTGGFTDCLLQRGASRVYAVDVGYGQFDWKLRNDSRVVLLERTNIRKLDPGNVPEPVDMAVIDVSFISLRLVVPKVREFLKKPGGLLVALVKPQFEAGRAEVGKGGIVRDEAARIRALEGVIQSVNECGLDVNGRMESPIKGQKGNIEYLIYAERRSNGRAERKV
jgi:23S rRNA (cytidine1920-2'-O)/16S rRNA (cytidine1409-2'-O)-methyltransferase